jgi:hypothetical protein
MSYFRIRARTRAHAFVPHTASPINNQPQYSWDAIPDGKHIAGGDMGAYFPTVPATREAGVLWREQTVPGLGALGLDIPGIGNLNVNSIIDPIVTQMEPAMDRVFNRYMPRVQTTVSSAVKSGIDQGVNAAWPNVERKVNTMIEPYKKVGIAFALVSVATLAGVMALLVKKGK